MPMAMILGDVLSWSVMSGDVIPGNVMFGGDMSGDVMALGVMSGDMYCTRMQCPGCIVQECIVKLTACNQKVIQH